MKCLREKYLGAEIYILDIHVLDYRLLIGQNRKKSSIKSLYAFNNFSTNILYLRRSGPNPLSLSSLIAMFYSIACSWRFTCMYTDIHTCKHIKIKIDM